MKVQVCTGELCSLGNQKRKKDETSNVFSELLNIEKGDILAFYERVQKDENRKAIFSRMHSMIMLIARMPEGNKSKLRNVEKVLDETNEKLSRILKTKGE